MDQGLLHSAKGKAIDPDQTRCLNWKTHQQWAVNLSLNHSLFISQVWGGQFSTAWSVIRSNCLKLELFMYIPSGFLGYKPGYDESSEYLLIHHL